MQWINLEDEHGKQKPKGELEKLVPENSGWYIVHTRTSMGNIHRLDCHWNGKHWHCTNQIVIKWLKEN